jgi:hypothetical protein
VVYLTCNAIIQQKMFAICLVTALCTMSVPYKIGSDTVVQFIQCYVDGNPGVVDQIKGF